MGTYNQIAQKIIREQEQLIGPVAWHEAGKVRGLHIVDVKNGTVTIDEGGDKRAIVNDLVDQYGSLFGQAAREVCKEAVAGIIADMSPDQVPASLK